jgi:chromosome segregation ATPase
VESLRREIAPHLRFLKKQIDKIEKAESLRKELLGLYPTYLQHEAKYLSGEKARVGAERQQLTATLHEVEHELRAVEAKRQAGSQPAEQQALQTLEHELRQLAGRKDELSRRLGRLEGMVEAVAAVPAPAERQFSRGEVLQLFFLCSLRSL